MDAVNAPNMAHIVAQATAREATRAEGAAENQKVALQHQRSDVTTSKRVGADRSKGKGDKSAVPEDGRGNKLDIRI